MILSEFFEVIGMSKIWMSQVVCEMIDVNIVEKVFEKGV